tara:strand:- start:1161 stop:2207 length:1047 start_codon:yes stop_codon:yes gene_type:complete
MTKLTLGIIGGGQLGSMMATSAKKLKIKTIIFSDDKIAPGQMFCDEFIFGDYNDISKIKEFTDKVDIVTFEFENIPYNALKKINEFKKVLPKPEVNKIIQNRLTEKDFINKLNIRTTEYKFIKNNNDLEKNINLLPGILKTCTLGYDGKGQYKINNLKEIQNIKIDFNQEYILEKLVDLKKEISVIIARFGKDKYEIYEPIENEHKDQILKFSKIPADIEEKNFIDATESAKKIAEALEYIGTLCVEFFLDKNNELYVNEVAPRVHNSGHLTINSHNISQFENHIRAVCNLEKKETKKLYSAEMVNLIGDDISLYKDKKLKNNEFFFDYKKKEIKPKRKMGHLTKIFK